MKVFEVCLTNYCNFKCEYCISDKTRGMDKFSEPIKLDDEGNLLLHDKELSHEEIKKRELILQTDGQDALDEYVKNEHDKWMSTRHLKHDYTDWLNFESLISFIRNNLSEEWLINLTGGEPLYYPKIQNLISELVKTHKILITTNASLVRNIPELLEIAKDRLYFRIGYHPEYRNLDTFKKCIDYLIENKFNYIINYVVHPSYYENESTKYEDHIKFLIDNQFQYELTPFEGKYNDKAYPSMRHNRSSQEEILFGPTDKYKQVHSPMGTAFLMCEPNGKIYECQGRGSELGDVYSNEVNLIKIQHSPCFSFKGCYTARSANTYLDVFFGTKLG